MPGDTENATSSPLPWQKTFILGIGILAIIHTILIAIWLSPPGPIRNTVGNHSLARYVDPYFQQSWESLDPSVQHVDETLSIRARVRDEKTGTTYPTEWFDLVDADNRALRHTLQPARVNLIGRRLATNLNVAMLRLSPDQQKVVNKNYVGKSATTLPDALLKAGASPRAITNYVAYDRMAVQFASMYAEAKWGEGVLEIQYRAGLRRVPEFADRKKTDLTGTPFSNFSFGWREAYPGQMEAQSAFDSYVKK